MKLLLTYYKEHLPLVLLALILAATNITFSFLDPYFYRIIIDDYATKFKEYDTATFFRGITLLLAGIVGVAMISRIAKNFQDYFVNVIVQKVGSKIYTDGIRHTLQLPFQSFEDQRSGETLGILQKVRADIERLTNLFINIIFSAIVAITFVTIYAIKVYWVLAPFYLSTVPLIIGISFFLSTKIKKIQKSIVSETTSLAGSTTESLRNIELIKGLGLAQQEINRLNLNTDKILQLELKKVKYIRTLSFIQGTILNLIRTSLSFIMLYHIFKGHISVGEFFSLFLYSFYIFSPLQEVGTFINSYREAEISLENFEKLLKQPIEPKPLHPATITEVDKLNFEDVGFKHISSNRNALTNINFDVNKGETVAFVGPSGSGKTTVIKLLVGLYKPIEGRIQYNGVDSNQIDLDELRHKIGLVTQDTQLFSGSLRENLLFVMPNATDEEMLEVLEKAACNSLLQRASGGLDSIIGEGGIKVSGGEKQRIAIARALLRNPSLLVFDEATSALDSITEEEISETIRNISKEKSRITVLVAHRLSTIMHADRIFVLEKGKIIEQGNHEFLLSQSGLYAAMWRQQIGESVYDTI